MTTPGQGRGGRGRRIAVVLVPGVGQELATETSRAVAEGLLAQADGYSRSAADAVDVVVPGGGGRPRELYRADRLSLRRGRDEIDLPGQYDWLEPAKPGALALRMRPFSFTWVNAYRARDFVGRAVFQDPLDPATTREGRGREWRIPGEPRPVRLVDVCLVGSGHHTGYWGDRELIAWLHGLLRAPEPRDPRGYVIEDATSAG